ncbi:hypothetical protein JET67_22180 [Pseudomonas palleroniana]|nr:hypothetical protein [Pseudomonas palleroniana]
MHAPAEDLPAAQGDLMQTMILAFTHKSWLGALSLAYDAGIENVHAWSRRACICNEWTVAYEVKA